MDQWQDYNDHINGVRSTLATQLASDPHNPDRFGEGCFVCGGPLYGERGKKGDVVWYVSRDSDPLHRRKPVSYEWRALTTEKAAANLLETYEKLADTT